MMGKGHIINIKRYIFIKRWLLLFCYYGMIYV